MALSLAINELDAGYGAVKALRGVTLHVGAGETVALLGTNGNGKSTLMKCIAGLIRPGRGSITLTIDGRPHDLTRLSPEAIVDLGVALVPECHPALLENGDDVVGHVAAGVEPDVHDQTLLAALLVVLADEALAVSPDCLNDSRPGVANADIPGLHRSGW